MITVTDLVKYHDADRVLDGASLSVKAGEVAVIVGPSGGGKSTLLRCLNGLETFQSGSIRVGELTLSPGVHGSGELLRLRRLVGMVFQGFHLFPHMTVLRNVTAGPIYARSQSRADAEAMAVSLLERVGMAHKLESMPGELSGGQQQRVAIARSLAVNPSVILFDEPTSSLDPTSSDEVLRVITDLASGGQTMVIVTHAMDFAAQAADSVHVMDAGRVIRSGTPEEILNTPDGRPSHDYGTDLSIDPSRPQPGPG